MRSHHLQSLAVKVLRAVYLWSERQYRREVLREALWRIRRDLAAKRKAEGSAQRTEIGGQRTGGGGHLGKGIGLRHTRHLTAV